VHPQVTTPPIVVTDEALPYLVAQKGRLQPLAHDRDAWLMGYRQAIDRDYRLIAPYLPPKPDGHAIKILDIGSGLGGIDVMLSRHYGGAAQVILMDGADDPPVMELHRKTFNDMRVAERFHRANGAAPIGWIDANGDRLPAVGAGAWPFDLVLSLGSWCFHYEPAIYLDQVKEAIVAGAVLILDVRKQRPSWAAQLISTFRLLAIVHVSDKIDRMVLRA
jgi:SAM-dependent methyltransferase